jgi:Inosine-uridine preferring nucleoside hydrolase/Bacterial extracellular solute-binding protein
MPKPIILDTDPGIGTPGSDVDDGLAIVLGLLHPACDLLGLTIVAGNVVHEEGLPNALRLLEIAGRTEVPVVPGATRPLLRDPRRIRELMGARRRQAVERSWDVPPFAPPTLAPATSRAAEFIADTLRGRPGEVTIVAIGPCTNVAAALLLDPAVARSVAEIVVMGGAIRVPGLVTPAVEFNKHKISPREQIPNLFYTGKLAMYAAPSYEANTLKSQYPNVNWLLVPHPYFKKPVTETGAWHVGVFSGTKNPDLAVALLKAYTDPEPAKRNYKIMNYMPVRESTFKALPETFEVMPNKLFYWEIVHTAIPRPRTPAYREYEDLLRQAFANVRQGADAAKEMNTAAEKINAQLRRYK